MLRKLQHELAHLMLWRRQLVKEKDNFDDETPPGFFMGEAGNCFENLISGGVISGHGQGMRTMSYMFAIPTGHPFSLRVPDEWVNKMMDSPDTLTSKELLISPSWKKITIKNKTGKHTMTCGDEEKEYEEMVLSDEEYDEIVSSDEEYHVIQTEPCKSRN
eukprot:TRINITY_DN3912_c0_g1_i3.p1 TRINITY_DN3912_c0_g1~~TRINITY_DN3912_c0_g1_i3.p1  ORF type:complete len:160 (+),score=38.42 TRINITY_DN3912_c0_g1_i3:171-650(+)